MHENEYGLKKQFDKIMQLALIQAKKAMKKNNIPVGAVLIKDNEIIASAHNDKFWHAEILCIQKAQKKIKSSVAEIGANQLMGTTMFVTVAPCPMCMHAIKLARISLLVFGADNTYEFYDKTEIISGIKAHEAKTLMQAFFMKKRTQKL